ncbi:UDP-N-acetylmuramate dehydrogenase [Ruminococcus sp. HUN007]|uniref:UDP-N-acetylmuramate dehydrogenase n=1 Tax=Ruminococcus sp. HUN007 TaxID=1514668 RepID=UPI0005D2509C|nr:UDP-N-acetylmuramate dehydrogenase [Ruminococcus sp. HUN007]
MSYLNELISLCDSFGCRYSTDESLKEHTTFRIGGKCRIAVFINSEESLASVVSYCRENSVKYAVLGNGSNVIAEDKFFDGAVIIIGNDFSAINYIKDGVIECESGLMLSRLCITARNEGYTGLEFAYGIPGTVGGALYMNAGAYGGEMSDVVISADYLDTDGEIRTISSECMDLSYRHSAFMNSGRIILRVRVRLRRGSVSEIEKKMDELITKRRDKQPLNFPSAGSTFKRPENNVFAAALIEQCGLKGFSVGDAQVSEKHSGFVINKGNATYEDLMSLVEHVREKVKADTGYELELEPEILK